MNLEELYRQFYFKKYIGALIQLKLMLQQNFVKFSRSFQVLILFLASMQSAIFIIRPISNRSSLQKGHSDFLRWMMYLARFDLFIIDQLPGIVYQNYFIMELALLVVFEIIIPNLLTIYQMYSKRLNQQYLDIQLHNQSIFISFWIHCYSIYAQLFIVYLKIPFYVLIIHQINTAYVNHEFKYFIMGLIVLLCVMLTHLSQISIFQESDSLVIQGFQSLNFSMSDVLIELSTIIQFIIYATVENPDDGSHIQAILMIGISILKLIQVIFLKFPINSHHYTIIVTQSITLTYTICWLTNYINLMGIIVVPLIYIIMQQFEYQRLRIIIEVDLLSEVKDIRFFMAQYVNNQFKQISAFLTIQTSIILNRHKQQCRQLQCSCQKAIQADDPKQLEFFKHQQLIDIYLKRMYTIYFLQMNTKSHIKFNNTDVLQYAQLLNHFGYSLLALQYCTKMLQIENQDQYRVNNHQQYSETQTYRSLITAQQNDENFIINKDQNPIQQYQINQGESVSWIMNLKFQTVIHRVKQQLHINFCLQSDPKKQSISNFMQRFLDHERQNQELQIQIIKIIQRKIELYQILSSTGALQVNQMFKIFKQIGQIAYNLELRICKQYDLFPSIRQQSIICFFQSEVMNNQFQASRYASLTAMSEDKLMDMQISSTDPSTKNVNYMILGLDQSCSQLQIEKSSNNLHQFFGYSYESFKGQSNINFLLPKGIIGQHRNLVFNFMQTGKSKYFRAQTLSFCREENQFIKPFKIITDLHYNSTNNFGFVCFFEQFDLDSAYIFVDCNNQIADITQSLFEKVGYTKAELQQYGSQLIQSYKCQITKVIPDFQNIKQGQMYSKLKILKLSYLKNRDYVSVYKSKNTAWWKKQKNYQVYKVSVQIKSYEFIQQQYHIIQLDNLQPEFEYNFVDMESHVRNSIDEDVRLLKPMESITNNIQDGQSNQFNKMMTMLQSYDIPDLVVPQLMSPNQETSRMLNTSRIPIQQEFFNNERKEDNINSQSSQMKIQFEKSNEDQLEDNSDEVKRVKQSKPNINQQYEDVETSASTGIRKSIFFNKYDLISKTTNVIGMPQSLISSYVCVILFALISSIYFIIVLEINTRDMKTFIDETQLLQVHSAFMAPLDNYQSMLTQLAQYIQIFQTNTVFTDFIAFANYGNWLITLVKEGYQNLQTSFNEQFSNPYTKNFFINNTFITRFLDHDYMLVERTLLFQQSLQILLEYQFVLRGFYQSYDIPVLIAGLNMLCKGPATIPGTDIVNQTLFSVCIGNYVAYQTSLYLTTGSMAAQIYVQANYFNFHNKFQDLSATILDYSLNRRTSVQEKWIWIWIPFILICSIFIALAYYCHRLYIRYYERFIDLFQHVDDSSLSKEIDKYKSIIGILQKNSNSLFRYHFDIDHKEKQILELKNQKGLSDIQNVKQQQQRRKRQDQMAKLPFLGNLLCFSLLFMLFIIFSMIIEFYNIRYLSQYSQTAQLYVSLSDITYILPGLYYQRDLALQIKTQIYYNQTDIDNLYSRIAFGLSRIQSFQIFLMNYDATQYLSNDLFNNQLSNMNSQGVCQYLNSTIQAQVSDYCNLAFEGVLNQGYYQSLDYVYNSLVNEQTINNFTKQTTFNLFEIEGAYILMRATQSLQASLYESISVRTDDSINISQNISACYIVLMVIMITGLFTYTMGYYENEFLIVRRCILLLPSQTLFLSDVFERQLRFINLKSAN